MKKKNSSTDHRWMLLKKCPIPVKCHQPGPLSARIVPEAMITISEAQRQDAEDVDPRRDVGRLLVGQQLLRGERADGAPAQPRVQDRCSEPLMASPRGAWPGNGARIATANTTSISTITTTFDTDI